MIHRHFAVSLLLLSGCGPAAAPSAGSSSPPGPTVALANGSNSVDLLGDGSQTAVFVARRDNGNAHGFSTAAFYILAKGQMGDTSRQWQIVPFFGGPNDGITGRELYFTSEGADCDLGDIRVLRHSAAPVELVIAHRELGASFADSASVSFYYYKLVRNTDGLVGWPSFFFKYDRAVRAKRQYCDVNTAFARELGLGLSGLGHADGGR